MKTTHFRMAQRAQRAKCHGCRALFLTPAMVVLAGASCSSAAKDVEFQGDLSSGGDGGAPTRPLTIEPISERLVLDPGWAMEVAFEGDIRINGVATGDFVPGDSAPGDSASGDSASGDWVDGTGSQGDEIVSVDRLGRIRILQREGGEFSQTLISEGLELQGTVGAQYPGGELVQVAAGDLDSSAPGDEIVAVGKAEGSEDDPGLGMVRVLSRSGPDGAWVEQRAVTPGLVHAIAVGDVLPDRPGLEFVFAGLFGEALVGYIDEASGTLLVDSFGAQHRGNAKAVCLMPDGIVLACDDGNTVRYRRKAAGAWTLIGTKQHGAALARIAAFDDKRVALCANDGTFRLLGGESFSSSTMLHRVDNRLRGAVIVDVDPAYPGVEACTAGYDGEIRVVYLLPEGELDRHGSPKYRTTKKSVARDTAKIHHLTSGTFQGLGPCLVSCGYSGDVLVVYPKK